MNECIYEWIFFHCKFNDYILCHVFYQGFLFSWWKLFYFKFHLLLRIITPLYFAQMIYQIYLLSWIISILRNAMTRDQPIHSALVYYIFQPLLSAENPSWFQEAEAAVTMAGLAHLLPSDPLHKHLAEFPSQGDSPVPRDPSGCSSFA